ncbi:MAG: cytidylate kinase-like family protein [Chloroflexi bacterium]|nr:cytidylate kinase-like family protein [Chloroflexota bacterium]
MAVVTLNGQLGGAAREVGQEVARKIGADYVDRLILAEAAKRVGATVSALAEKEQEHLTLANRLTRLLQTAFERSAYTGSGGDPFFGPGVDALLVHPYPEGHQEQTATSSKEVDENRFFGVIGDILKDLAEEGNVVIMGRGSNLVLKNFPGVLHVGVVAPVEFRIETTMRRDGMSREAAEKYIADEERARISFFKRHFKAHPDDPLLYHMVVNPGTLGIETSAVVISQAVALTP